MNFRISIKFFLAAAWLSAEASAATGVAHHNSSEINSYQGLRRKSASASVGSESSVNSRRLQAFLPEDLWPNIDYVGDGGDFDVFPLELCMGDCDSDDDCAGNLKCFQRDANVAVPGCQGGALLSLDASKLAAIIVPFVC